MGEGKRRKQSSTPNEDPIEKERKFWSNREAPAIEDFVAPDGLLSLTIDCEGTDPSTIIINPASIANMMSELDKSLSQLKYRSMCHMLWQMFVSFRKKRDEDGLSSVAYAVLWSCFNHPQQGERFRVQVSESLRSTNKCHITWRCGSTGLAIAIGQKFVDLEELAAKSPGNTVTVYRDRPLTPRKDMN